MADTELLPTESAQAPISPETGIVAVVDGRPCTTSLSVAEHFGKRHDTVLRAVRDLECSEEFSRRNFAGTSYTDSQGKPRAAFSITRDGFVFLAMGFTGPEAARWKERYLEAFNLMEAALARPAAAPAPQLAGPTFDRVVAERDALRAMLAERVLREEPRLRKVIYYYNMPGLSHRERALLMGWKKANTFIVEIKRLALLGLVDYQPSPMRTAQARRNLPTAKQPAAPQKVRGPAGNPGGASRDRMLELHRIKKDKAASRKAGGAA